MELKVIRPQKEAFEKTTQISVYSSRVIMVASVFSCCYSIAAQNLTISDQIASIATGITAFLTIASWALKIWYACKFHEAESQKHQGLIDNAFGVKLAQIKSENYYDNDDVNAGISKLVANVHESCLFTARILKKTIEKKAPFIWLPMVVILVCAVIGFAHIPFIDSIFMLLLSELMLGDIVAIYILKNKAKKLEAEFRRIWQIQERNTLFSASALYVVIEYESLISRMQMLLDEKVYEEQKINIEKEWSEIRMRYGI